jgi:hypothetical protein
MGLLQDIEHAVTSSHRPLSDVLRMAKILAAKLDNALLRDWVDQELNGYAEDAPCLPTGPHERSRSMGTSGVPRTRPATADLGDPAQGRLPG